MAKAKVEVDSDFGDHVQSLRRLRELQTNLAMKQNHLIDYKEAANWFAISNGNESDEYAALISDLQKEIEDINTEIMSLSKNSLDKGNL